MADKIPDWAEKNRELFSNVSGPPVPKPAVSGISFLRAVMSKAAVQSVARAVCVGVLIQPRGGINPPPPGVHPDADYFRNVDNHPDILATMLETARVAAGYNPLTGGGNTTDKGKAQAQVESFAKWVEEIDKYYTYLPLIATTTDEVNNSSHDCNSLLRAVATVVETALGDSGTCLIEKITEGIISASDYITSGSGSSEIYDVGFHMVNVPAPDLNQPTANPIASLCTTILSMKRETTSGKGGGTTTSDYFYITALTYQLKSSAVIDNANYLASGSTIVPPEKVTDSVNARP